MLRNKLGFLVGLGLAVTTSCGGSLAPVTPGDDAGDNVSVEAGGIVAQPPADAGGGPTSPGPTTPALLAKVVGDPHAMKVDASGLYLTVFDGLSAPPGGAYQDALWRIPLDGSAPVKLLDDFILFDFALDADAAYVPAGSKGYGGNARILRIGKKDGSKLELTTPCDRGRLIRAVAVNDSDVYFGCADGYDYPGDGGLPTEYPGFIARMPKTGGPVEMVVPVVWWPSSIVLDGDTMFFGEDGGGTIESCPLTGGGSGPTVRASMQFHPRSLTLVGSTLFWVTSYGNDYAWSMPTAPGSAPVKLAYVDWFDWFTADASGTYWSSLLNYQGALWHAAPDGSGTTPVTTKGGSSGPIAVASDAVYFAPGDTGAWGNTLVWRLPKP